MLALLQSLVANGWLSHPGANADFEDLWGCDCSGCFDSFGCRKISHPCYCCHHFDSIWLFVLVIFFLNGSCPLAF
jgi:hypothetical protein